MIEISKEISTSLRKKGYKIEEELNNNYLGGRTTYKGINLKTKSPVVIKYFRLLGAKTWSGYNAIEREIKTLQTLNHPNIPRYIESWEINGDLFIITEYIDAPNASKQRFKEQEIQRIAIALLEILFYLHGQNPAIIHRDIKPENILVDKDFNVYLVDFGLAKATEGETTTASTTIAGTLGFMSPELMRNKPCRASDLYALGITLICLLYQINSGEIGNYLNEDFSVNFKGLPKKSVPKKLISLVKKLTEPKLSKRITYPSDGLKYLNTNLPETNLKQKRLQKILNSLAIFTDKRWLKRMKRVEISLRKSERFEDYFELVFLGFSALTILVISFLIGRYNLLLFLFPSSFLPLLEFLIKFCCFLSQIVFALKFLSISLKRY